MSSTYVIKFLEKIPGQEDTWRRYGKTTDVEEANKKAKEMAEIHGVKTKVVLMEMVVERGVPAEIKTVAEYQPSNKTKI